MKILLFSDCHANIDSLNAVWKKESDCDRIIFAGDMIDWGLFPLETVRWFMDRRDILTAVRGNHDEYIISKRDELSGFDRKAKSCAELACQKLGDEEFEFVSSLPHETCFTIEDTDYYMCHTPDTLSNNEVFYVERLFSEMRFTEFFNERFSTCFPQSKAKNRRLIYGHTHWQWAITAGINDIGINPGSTNNRFGSAGGIKCADYAVLEDDAIYLRHVDYDTSELYKLIDKYDFDDNAKTILSSYYG